MDTTTLHYVNATHTVTLELPLSAGNAFHHLLDLSKWWPEDYVGEKVELGTGFILKVGDGHFSKNKVIEFIPDKRLVWLTTESRRKADGYDWSGTHFIFELTPKGNHTLLSFTYEGVVLRDECERLIQVCDLCIKEMFYNYAVKGIAK